MENTAKQKCRQRYDHDVFISYRRSNGAAEALLLFRHLCEMGYRPYLDLETMRGGLFDKQILRHIDVCKDIVVVLSEGATVWRENRDDDWMRMEIAHALEKGVNVIPVFLPGFVMPKNPAINEPVDVRDMYRYNGIKIDDSWTNFDLVMRRMQVRLKSRPHGFVAKQIKKAIAFVCMIAAIAIVAWKGSEIYRESLEHETVLMVGSGTVGNYLRRLPEIANDRQICIFDAASFSAFDMIQEVRNSSCPKVGASEKSKSKDVYVLVMSAARMDENNKRFAGIRSILEKERLRLVEVHLPEKDSLQVVLKPADAFNNYIDQESGTISIERLGELLSQVQASKAGPKDGEYLIYRTSEESGTLAMFNKELTAISSNCAVRCDLSLQFMDKDGRGDLRMNEKNKVIVLCAEMYRPHEDAYLGDGGKRYRVTKGGKDIEKDLYLYFVIGENEAPSSAMKMFLKKITREDILDHLHGEKWLDQVTMRIYQDEKDADDGE